MARSSNIEVLTLVSSAAEGPLPEQGFIEFYERYYRLIHTVAHQRLGNIDDAEDTAAEVFKIARTHHQAGNELRLPWLYTVLRNLVGEQYRRRRRDQERLERIYAQSPQVSDNITTAEVLDVRRALEQLADHDRELLRMAFWEDLAHQEIGQLLGCTASTVRVRVLRAKRRFKAALEGAPGAKQTSQGMA